MKFRKIYLQSWSKMNPRYGLVMHFQHNILMYLWATVEDTFSQSKNCIYICLFPNIFLNIRNGGHFYPIKKQISAWLGITYVQLCISKGVFNICRILGHIFFNQSKHIRINNGAFIPEVFLHCICFGKLTLISIRSPGDCCVMTHVFDLFCTEYFFIY